MPLTPPPDYTKVLAAAVVGITLALTLSLFTRSTLPIVGDSQHRLPHGGIYKDGTKTVYYSSPGKLNSVEGGNNRFLRQPWAIVVILGAVIYLVERFSNSKCRRCGQCHI